MANRSFLPNAPSKSLWIIAVVIGIIGIITHFVHVEEVSKYNFTLLLIGFILLVFGTSFKKM